MVLAAYDSGLYKLLLLGHIASFLVAFAPAVIHPLITAQSKAHGPAELGRVAGYMAANARRVHLPALVALGAFGIGLVLESDPLWAFDQAWVSLALLAWIAIGAIVVAVLMPAERRLAAGDLEAEKRVQQAGPVITILLLVILYLMIWKPGL
jgi:uncharacterized membrane protein